MQGPISGLKNKISFFGLIHSKLASVLSQFAYYHKFITITVFITDMFFSTDVYDCAEKPSLKLNVHN